MTIDITMDVVKANKTKKWARRLEKLWFANLARIVAVQQEYVGPGDIENIKGDCFNPTVNPEIDPIILQKEEEALEQKIVNEGVWGIQALNLVTGDEGYSCYGFVGNEYLESGYDVDCALSLVRQMKGKRT